MSSFILLLLVLLPWPLTEPDGTVAIVDSNLTDSANNVVLHESNELARQYHRGEPLRLKLSVGERSVPVVWSNTPHGRTYDCEFVLPDSFTIEDVQLSFRECFGIRTQMRFHF